MMSFTSTNPGDLMPRIDNVADSKASPAEHLAEHLPYIHAEAKNKVGKATIGISTASDFAQDCVVAALQAANDGRFPEANPPAEARYLWTTLVNKIREAIRKSKSKKHGGEVTIVPFEGHQVPGSGTTPSSKLVRKTREEHLRSAMDTLDPRDQLVLKLRLVEEKSTPEIAQILGVSERHVRNLRHQAIERLRDAYLANGGTWDFD